MSGLLKMTAESQEEYLLSVRTYVCLKRAGLNTAGRLKSMGRGIAAVFGLISLPAQMLYLILPCPMLIKKIPTFDFTILI